MPIIVHLTYCFHFYEIQHLNSSRSHFEFSRVALSVNKNNSSIIIKRENKAKFISIFILNDLNHSSGSKRRSGSILKSLIFKRCSNKPPFSWRQSHARLRMFWVIFRTLCSEKFSMISLTFAMTSSVSGSSKSWIWLSHWPQKL